MQNRLIIDIYTDNHKPKKRHFSKFSQPTPINLMQMIITFNILLLQKPPNFSK